MSVAQRMARGWVSVVPVLFLDFLVIALPAGVLPIVLNSHYGQRAYLLGGWAATCKGLLAFLTSPALGALSDVIGRKWLFFACVLGTAAPYAVLGLGASLDTHLILLGLSGHLSATFPLAFAFIADSVAPQQRASAFGATIGLGLGGAFFVGPALGATIDELLGTSAVFKACVAVTAFNAAFAVVVLHEPPSRGRLTWSELLRRSNPCRSFTGLLVASRPMRLLSVITLFYYLALWGFLANKGVYARRRFQLTSRETAAQVVTRRGMNQKAPSLNHRSTSPSPRTALGLWRRLVALPDGWPLRRPQGGERGADRAGLLCLRDGRRAPVHGHRGGVSPSRWNPRVGAMLIYGFATDSRLLYPAMALLGLSVGGFATVSSLCSQASAPCSAPTRLSNTPRRPAHRSCRTLSLARHRA